MKLTHRAFLPHARAVARAVQSPECPSIAQSDRASQVRLAGAHVSARVAGRRQLSHALCQLVPYAIHLHRRSSQLYREAKRSSSGPQQQGREPAAEIAAAKDHTLVFTAAASTHTWREG